jgi:hypothetical protein
MLHHFDGEAWKQFNRVYPQFFLKPWNICVGLYTNEFNLFGSFVAPYFYWSVILIIFNLLEFMFLSMFIHDSNIPGRNINSFLQALINELKQLWSSETLMYDVSRKQTFQMMTALI